MMNALFIEVVVFGSVNCEGEEDFGSAERGNCVEREEIASSIEATTSVSPSEKGVKDLEITIFLRSLRGRNLGGMLSQVLRPMITAFLDWGDMC